MSFHAFPPNNRSHPFILLHCKSLDHRSFQVLHLLLATIQLLLQPGSANGWTYCNSLFECVINHCNSHINGFPPSSSPLDNVWPPQSGFHAPGMHAASCFKRVQQLARSKRNSNSNHSSARLMLLSPKIMDVHDTWAIHFYLRIGPLSLRKRKIWPSVQLQALLWILSAPGAAKSTNYFAAGTKRRDAVLFQHFPGLTCGAQKQCLDHIN